ncbi:MAG: ankyrin repeat domain-containing protein, partial [Candidatus Berkiella sp.]
MLSDLHKLSSWVNPFHNENNWLGYAVKFGNIALVKTTLTAGADPNYIRVEDFYSSYPSQRQVSVLYLATENKHVDIANILLDAGADANGLAKYDNEHTKWIFHGVDEISLNPAVRNGDIEMVDLLLSYGANPNVDGFDFKSYPLKDAVTSNNLAIAKLLLENGAEIGTALFDVNKVEMAKLLIEYGATFTGGYFEISGYNVWLMPDIIRAINENDVNKAQLLTEAGAGLEDLKKVPDFDELMVNLLKHNVAVSEHQWVLEFDGAAKLNMSEAHLAVLHGDVQGLLKLHENHFDFNVVDKLGYTPFHYIDFMPGDIQYLQPIIQEALVKMGTDLFAASCVKDHIGEPVWKVSQNSYCFSTKLKEESLRIKAFQEKYQLNYDSETKTLSSKLV